MRAAGGESVGQEHSTGLPGALKGCSLDRSDGKYRARINCFGRRIFLGKWTDPWEAARVYDRAAVILKGPAAVTNFGIASALADETCPLKPEVVEALTAAREATRHKMHHHHQHQLTRHAPATAHPEASTPRAAAAVGLEQQQQQLLRARSLHDAGEQALAAAHAAALATMKQCNGPLAVDHAAVGGGGSAAAQASQPASQASVVTAQQAYGVASPATSVGSDSRTAPQLRRATSAVPSACWPLLPGTAASTATAHAAMAATAAGAQPGWGHSLPQGCDADALMAAAAAAAAAACRGRSAWAQPGGCVNSGGCLPSAATLLPTKRKSAPNGLQARGEAWAPFTTPDPTPLGWGPYTVPMPTSAPCTSAAAAAPLLCSAELSASMAAAAGAMCMQLDVLSSASNASLCSSAHSSPGLVQLQQLLPGSCVPPPAPGNMWGGGGGAFGGMWDEAPSSGASVPSAASARWFADLAPADAAMQPPLQLVGQQGGPKRVRMWLDVDDDAPFPGNPPALTPLHGLAPPAAATFSWPPTSQGASYTTTTTTTSSPFDTAPAAWPSAAFGISHSREMTPAPAPGAAAHALWGGSCQAQPAAWPILEDGSDESDSISPPVLESLLADLLCEGHSAFGSMMA